jgi:hypothetical protein
LLGLLLTLLPPPRLLATAGPAAGAAAARVSSRGVSPFEPHLVSQEMEHTLAHISQMELPRQYLPAKTCQPTHADRTHALNLAPAAAAAAAAAAGEHSPSYGAGGEVIFILAPALTHTPALAWLPRHRSRRGHNARLHPAAATSLYQARNCVFESTVCAKSAETFKVVFVHHGHLYQRAKMVWMATAAAVCRRVHARRGEGALLVARARHTEFDLAVTFCNLLHPTHLCLAELRCRCQAAV